MKFLKTTSIAIFVLMITSIAQSAILRVAIDGIENITPDNIWTYQVNFDVVGESSGINVTFNDSTQYLWEVVPGFKIPNWNHASAINGDQLVILADNKGNKLQSPLVNGLLFEVNYGSSTDLDLVFFSFVSEDLLDVTVPLTPIFDKDTNTLTFSTAVPVPSSLFLLGGGLFALVGITRRKK